MSSLPSNSSHSMSWNPQTSCALMTRRDLGGKRVVSWKELLFHHVYNQPSGFQENGCSVKYQLYLLWVTSLTWKLLLLNPLWFMLINECTLSNQYLAYRVAENSSKPTELSELLSGEKVGRKASRVITLCTLHLWHLLKLMGAEDTCSISQIKVLSPTVIWSLSHYAN